MHSPEQQQKNSEPNKQGTQKGVVLMKHNTWDEINFKIISMWVDRNTNFKIWFLLDTLVKNWMILFEIKGMLIIQKGILEFEHKVCESQPKRV